ncbi:regulator of V-ATPase in vacuolar membrane protein 1 [[Candida] railenensis]|uniref:Regulator of V-ATPase in vacuolar membrane protein 1 n=1 Tax=[Candida] railenensis TaxID=45579 RepID=A0A9P0QVE7_9ASCO|nr:regulator of V-ATPase in vacuolar membrane protein 1 [[Candida] railenensis]
MTLTFVPGEVNPSPYSLAQCVWKNHHIIVYGSGNNLIISTSNVEANLSNIQTIYLESDPVAIDLNELTGYIAISIKAELHIYSPVNEYSLKPKWGHALSINLAEEEKDQGMATGDINCLQWAVVENELLVGTNGSLSLFHVYDEFGDLKYNQRWYSVQPNPVHYIKTTRNASKFVSRGNYDRTIKVWSRCSYGDTTSLFSLTYLEHPEESYVVDFKWKQIHEDEESEAGSKNLKLDSSMTNIKNFGGLGLGGLLDNDNDNDILYTLTNSGVVRVWANDSTMGHSKIRKLGQLQLNFIKGKLSNLIVVDNYNNSSLRNLVTRSQGNHSQLNGNVFDKISTAFSQSNGEPTELLLAISEYGQVQVYSATAHVNSPTQFKRLDDEDREIYFNKNCFPNKKETHQNDFDNLSLSYIQSVDFLSHHIQPIVIPEVCLVGNNISILIQDRVKNTIRECFFSFAHLLSQKESSPENSGPLLLGTTLINKFSGHNKAIRKIRKSTASTNHSNILISISDFPQDNYIWEPLTLRTGSRKTVTLTKRFQIDCSIGYQDENIVNGGGIWDAIIINDIEEQQENYRHHLVISIEKTGCISFWDCNGLTMDDKPVELIDRLRLEDNDGHYIYKCPKAFVSTAVRSDELNSKLWCVIGVFENNLVRSWIVKVKYNKNSSSILKVTIENGNVSSLPLPDDEHIHQIQTMDSLLGESPRNLLTTIDTEGKLRNFAMDTTTLKWKETCSIRTNLKNVSKIHGASSIHKVAVVDETGYNLSIWDTKNGVLEYEESFKDTAKEKVRDMDWIFIDSISKRRKTATSNAIFSVGFSRHVLLYTQLRYDYTNNIPSFGVLKKLDISDYTSHEIGDSIWLNHAYLVIASGNQFFIDDRWVTLGSSSDQFIDSTIKQLLVGYLRNDISESNYRRRSVVATDHLEEVIELEISNLARILNGPLPVYHPQFLIQALFLNKIGMVKDILVRLLKVLRFDSTVKWDLEMNLSDELMDSSTDSVRVSGSITPVTAFKENIFADNNNKEKIQSLDTFFEFNQQLSELLIEKLTKYSLPLLTRHQQSTLITVISCVLEIDKNFTSMDSNGIRFLIGFKLFQSNAKQTQLTMRDISWALHSDNQEMVINVIEESHKNRLKWRNVREAGMAFWINDHQKLANIIEKCARNEFGDNRDPSGILSLFYLALNKKNVLIGLWKSVSHQEQQKMLKFLSNDFNEKRWKTASLKNAFVLLSKHRYFDAAYFFLLADSLKDCCNVIANKIQDVNLCLAVAKVYEHTKKTSAFPIDSCIPHIIETWILPEAIQKGDRWTTSWIFWELKQREISVRSLIESPISIITQHKDCFSDTCIKNNLENVHLDSTSKIFLKDDPVLILMFDNLRHNNVNLLKGALEISPMEEFNFVIKVSLIYTRMGCDYLGLQMVRNWEFVKFDSTKNLFQRPSNGLLGTNGDDIGTGVGAGIERIPSSIPSLLVGGAVEKNGFGTDKPTSSIKSQPPPTVAFEEPDMSSFDFGF